MKFVLDNDDDFDVDVGGSIGVYSCDGGGNPRVAIFSLS